MNCGCVFTGEQTAVIAFRQTEFQDAQAAAVQRRVIAGQVNADWRVPRNGRPAHLDIRSCFPQQDLLPRAGAVHNDKEALRFQCRKFCG
jgi:hypothetical protein